ncbi:hypothetical protein H6F78_02935 [Coleofasciculus sp. FACHB-64]|uniref:hypothetical protein n=1 Tax=Cyanophyceae TaxID=3028117 RepID=UPI00168A009E|nr:MULTISPECIES: hypothetical protein [unclassified Coleofasciculus]MBD1839860.1 hypothetical protein [Coleofasciculus sp. FACHB-501]MBD2044595.1 hypothetical protein [Coleofasciculus sp. FACHB-64]
MRLQKTKVLTGTMLTLLLSAVSVLPAIARPVSEGESRQLISQTNTDTPTANPTNTNTTTPNSTDTNQVVRGTVSSVRGNVVTLRLPDGTTRSMMLSPEDLTRLNLMPGMEISATLDDQNMASNVSMVEAADATDTTRLNRTRRVEETTIQRRTVQTTPSPGPTTTTGETTSTPDTVQTEPQTTEAAPVPALW